MTKKKNDTLTNFRNLAENLVNVTKEALEEQEHKEQERSKGKKDPGKIAASPM